MSNVRFTGLLALCAALAACSESASNSAVTDPHVGSALQARAEQAATGPRASGHAEVGEATTGTTPYSFIALSTGASPNAKGQVEGHIRFANGQVLDIHADVDCLVFNTDGTEAWISGPITKQRAFTPGQPPEDQDPMGHQVRFRVRDNGEGGTATGPDESSGLDIGSTTSKDCNNRPPFQLFPSQNGNIQVRP
jgi:hypothetical protein